MKRALHLIVLSAAMLSGCATTPASPPQPPKSDVFIGYLTFHVGARAGDTFKVTTNEVTGPRLQLARVDGGFRGVALRQQAVDLRVEKGVVTGSLGTQPIELHVNHRDGKIWLEGLYGGRVVNLFFGERARDTKQTCGAFQPWISLSNGESDEAPDDGGDLVSCDVTSVAALAHMMAYLGEDEALTLIAVMGLNNAFGRLATVAPPVARNIEVGAGPRAFAAHAYVGHR